MQRAYFGKPFFVKGRMRPQNAVVRLKRSKGTVLSKLVRDLELPNSEGFWAVLVQATFRSDVSSLHGSSSKFGQLGRALWED